MSKPTVFLSAATVDLKRWRDHLHTAFARAGFQVITQDKSLGAALKDVRQLLTDHIAESDCVIHLAGQGYGAHAKSPFPEAPDFRCSWTQFEYYYAHKLKKDVIAFVCAPNLSAANFEEKGDAAEVALKRTLQLSHRERVASGHFDGTPLAGQVSRTLNEEVGSHANLLEAVAAAVGALGKKDPAYDRVRDELAKIQASLDRLEEGQREAMRFSRRALAITTTALLALGALGWWAFLGLQKHSQESAEATVKQMTTAKEAIAAEVRGESSKLATGLATSNQTATEIKAQVAQIDRKLSELPAAAPILRLESTPAGAAILRPAGLEQIGLAPLSLSSIASTDRAVILNLPGYLPRLVTVPAEAKDPIKVALEPATPPMPAQPYHCALLQADFVWIPTGSVEMGSPPEERGSNASERPVTSVIVTHGFWMARYELTNSEAALFFQAFRELAKTAPDEPAAGLAWAAAISLCQQITHFEQTGGRLPPGWRYDLPTEAEWEFACRAGTSSAFFNGPDETPAEQFGWYFQNSGGRPHRVGEKQPNSRGLYDLYGNVEEWCLDWYGSYPGGTTYDYSGPGAGLQRVSRGGSFDGLALRDSRSASRQRHNSADRSRSVGMRLILRTTP